MNYWYVPQEPDQVGFCAAPTRGRGNAWVISDQFGGCEWHIRQNDQLKLFAFLHVSRGFGKTAQYQPAPGWKKLEEQRSANLGNAGGHQGEKISGSRISAVRWGWAGRSPTSIALVPSRSSFPPSSIRPHTGFRERLAALRPDEALSDAVRGAIVTS